MGEKVIFEKGLPYHILSRAVEKRKIFRKEEDCYRFIFQMHAANVGSPAYNLRRKDVIKTAKNLLKGEEIPSEFIIREHLPLVDILSFVLVMDHNHFNLVPKVEYGIEKYMQKLNGGFAKYYNLKYNRSGALFESRYKRIPIKDDFQLAALTRYINVINPLDVFQPNWRKTGIRDWRAALKFLNGYPFSSFPDLFGERKSRIITFSPNLEKYLSESKGEQKKEYIKFVEDYLKDRLASLGPFFPE